jgi:hypothetical protein
MHIKHLALPADQKVGNHSSQSRAAAMWLNTHIERAKNVFTFVGSC